jgi:hypothetical protein
LTGYIDEKIEKPGPESIPLPSDTASTQPINTPVYSMTPTLDKWNFRDQLTRGHITLNWTDVAGLGVVTTRMAKQAWDSIQIEWGKSTDMCQSHVQKALNWIVFAKGTDIQDHIKLLWTWKVAVNNLSTSAMNDETWKGIIIRSIPPTAKWLPVIPSLYAVSSSADIISILFAHGMTIGRNVNTKGSTTANSLNTALAVKVNKACTNPNCKAKKRSTHTEANCYWPGGGKKGQFPLNSARGIEQMLLPVGHH